MPDENEAQKDVEQFFEFMRSRTGDLTAAGMEEPQARGTALLEARVERWPSEWGDQLHIIVYGDFSAPVTDWHFPDLGIIIEAGEVKTSLIKTAMRVVKGRVTISERTVRGLTDACARINQLLGAWSAVEWGNSGIGWWSSVTHGSPYGVMGSTSHDVLQNAVTSIAQLRADVRRKVVSALYWIREPRQMMMEGYRNDILQVYAGYWNAFENLVEAVSLLRPQRGSRGDKQKRINDFLVREKIPDLLARGGTLSPDVITGLYRLVEPGFVAKASNALRQCFGERAEVYVRECFLREPKRSRLYNIRNDINHGNVDAGNLEELIRLESRHRQLWLIVFGMLGSIIAVPRPIDPIL